MSSRRRVRDWLAGVGGLLLLSGPSPLQAQICESCDDFNVCTDDVCVSGVCRSTNNTAPCNDGNACTSNDTCSGGVCVSGAALVCNDNNPCTNDTCNPATGCVFTNNTTPCNDANACTTNDTCSGGTCVGGAGLNCNDANICTDDACNPLTGCTHTNNSAPCNDGSACTTSDTCSGGTCVGGAPPNCNDANVCTNDSCNPASGCVHVNNASPCNDGNACTTTDVCSGGTCVGSGAPNCNDGNLCTNDSCNPASGCVHVNNTSPCNDENACTTNDTCSGGICVGGTPIQGCQDECTEPSQCDDGNGCTTDTCPAGVCVFTNNTNPCDDGNACTTNDTCAEGVCQIGVSVDCSGAGDACNTASCDPNGADGNCAFATPVAAGTACNDGDHCTAVDECVNGACVEDLPAYNDPYRCVGLEWRQNGSARYNVGDTVLLSLYAVADGCNTPSSGCPPTSHAIWHIYAILEWDPATLQLQTPTTGNPNPADPCDDVNCAVSCPAGAYNWLRSGFPDDCGSDQLNQPCGAFPSNDGDAFYVSTAYTTCTAVPMACATPSGLEVTTFKFTVLGIPAGGVTQVGLLPCTGNFTKSLVWSRINSPPGYRTVDVTKWLGPASTITVPSSCNNNADCADPDLCTIDACVAGNCRYTDVNCDDGVACTTDTCVHASGSCTHTPNHAFCNPTNSFCSAARCDPLRGCILDHECISLNGNPCPNPATCNETTDTCGGCKQPIMVAAGPRYLAVTPADQGSTPVALLVTGDCSNPNAACVYRYVQSKCNGGSNNGQNCNTDADCPKRCVGGQFPGAVCSIATNCPQGDCAGKCDAGTLGATPFFKTAAQWGTAKVGGAQIRPETTYMAHTECGFGGPTVLSSAASAKTWKWGDVENNGIVNALDIANLVNFLKGFFGPFTFEQMNIWGCVPDDVINALDIAVEVDAVREFAFPCSVVCP